MYIRQHKKSAGENKRPPKAPMIKIKPRPASSTEVATDASVPKSSTAAVNIADASNSTRLVSFMSSLAFVLCSNEDIQDVPMDDLLSPRTEEVVPALFL